MRRLRKAARQGSEEAHSRQQQGQSQTRASQTLVQSTQKLLARLKNDVRFSQQDESRGESVVPRAAGKRRKNTKIKNGNKLFKNEEELDESESSRKGEQLPCQVNYKLSCKQVKSRVHLDQIFKRVQSIQKQQEIIKFIRKQKLQQHSPQPSPSKEEIKLIAPKDHRKVFKNVIFIQQGKKTKEEKVVLKRSTSREDFDAQLQTSLMGQVQVQKYLQNIERKTRFSAVKKPQTTASNQQQKLVPKAQKQEIKQHSVKQSQPTLQPPTLQNPKKLIQSKPVLNKKVLKANPKKKTTKPKPPPGKGFCKYFQEEAEMSDDHSSQGHQSQGDEDLKDLIDNSGSNQSSGVKRQYVVEEQARHQLQVQKMLNRLQARKYEPQYSTDSNQSLSIPKHLPKSLKEPQHESPSESSQEQLPPPKEIKPRLPVKKRESVRIFKEGIERAVKQTKVRTQIAKNSILQSKGCKTYIGL